MKFQNLSSTQLSNLDREQTLVVIPIAAVEQHGPHMPTGTDSIICTAVCESLETRLENQILLTPTVWLGASSHHLRFGATLNTELDTFVDTLCDIGKSLLDDGFKRLLFVNGHGGNIDPMRMALRKLQPSYHDALLVGGSYWSVADEWIRDHLDGDHKFVAHACEFETSMLLHLNPELVDQENLINAGELISDRMSGMFISRDMWQRTRSGYTGRPDLATAEKGEQLFDGIVDRLLALAEKLLVEPHELDYENFVN